MVPGSKSYLDQHQPRRGKLLGAKASGSHLEHTGVISSANRCSSSEVTY